MGSGSNSTKDPSGRSNAAERCDFRYCIVPERLYHPDLGEYHTYGIQVTVHDFTKIVHDVFVCKKKADHMVRLLNFHQVSDVHLRDVIVDMI